MRTDSMRLSDEAVKEVRAIIASARTAKAFLPEKPNVFKTKKQNVQDAHEAIRPTRIDLPPDAVREYLNDERSGSTS